MELSGMELRHIVVKLDSMLSGYYVNNVYSVDAKTVLLKLHHAEKLEQRLVISAGRGMWATKYDLTQKGVSPLVAALRRRIVRAKIIGIEQPDLERLAVVNLASGEEEFKLICEFFSEGNIILTDGRGVILTLLHPLSVRHRVLALGKVYSLPPSKAMDLVKLSLERLKDIQGSTLNVARWLGRNLSLPKKYVEEVLAQASIDFEKKGFELSDFELEAIFNRLVEVARVTESGDAQPQIVYVEGKPVDVTPFLFKTYSNMHCEPVGSFLDGVDEVFSSEIQAESKDAALEPLRRRLGEIERSLQDQRRAEEELRLKARMLREFAEGLLKLPPELTQKEAKEFAEELVKLGASDMVVSGGRLTVALHGVKVEADDDSSLYAFASKVFDKAKELKEAVRTVVKAEESLKHEVEKMVGMVELSASRMEKLKWRAAREKSWFERFRWFITSDGLLAVGGRDATSNSLLIRKHLSKEDVVFHADIHGSPFFILKGYLPQYASSVLETAQATVTYSSAWRAGMSSGDAYWVLPQQVKKQAPSGMYLPRGGFMIEGRKNLLKNLEVKVAVGLYLMKEYLVVMAGPPDAVRKNCLVYVVVTPERLKTSDLAKKIKSGLAGLVKAELIDEVKRIPLDDIVRALPGGGILKLELGEQKC